MSEKKPYLSERVPPQRMIDVFWGDAVQHIFADGAARVMLGSQITKIELTRSFGPKSTPDGDIEQRESFAILAMPTPAIAELCGTILEQYVRNLKLIENNTDMQAAQIKEIIKRVAAIKL